MNDRPVNREISYNGASQHFGNNIENNFFGDGFPINQQKKRYTNKKLVVPFTKEASNGSQGGTYVQRDDLLGKIESCFGSQSGNKRMVFLSGMGGCGKSELARAYGDKHSDEYEDIFWLTCRDGVKPELMRLIADADKLEEVKKADVNEFSDKVLIIVDNCNSDDDSFLFTLERSTGHADILVTTRRSRIGNYEEFLIPVESDDLEAFAYSVFEKNFCRKPRRGEPKKITDDDAVCVREICREVQYNTMMVSMIGIRLRENNDLSIPDCAREIRKGVGRLRGRIKYSKDLVPRSEEIKDILDFLFTDILSHQFTDEEKTILTILSLTPASWYAIDFIISLCRGGKSEPEYNDALMDLLDFGWLQGNSERIAIHPLVAEALSYKQILAVDPIFYKGLAENYLGVPDAYLGKERFLMNKILNLGGRIPSETRLVLMLMINHGGYKELFEGLFPEVKIAFFVYVNYDGRRQFLYRDLQKEETHLLFDIPCQQKKSEHVVLLKIINIGISYKLDLKIAFCGKEIEKIPDGLCWKDHYLRELSFPNKLIDIGENAFYDCRGLSGELGLPESLKSIGSGVFSGCTGLSGELYLPESLTSIGDYAFFGCRGLSGELYLPDGLKSIGDCAFSDCSGLSGELRLPESMTNIGKCAFSDCRGLSGELSLPEGMTSIEKRAFYGCSGLSGELRLPEGMTSIGESAFYGCSGLSGKLSLPKGLTNIGDFAFSGCSGLSGELSLPESLTSIGDYAFYGCSGLSGELRLPESLKSIGDSAFAGCSGLSGELCPPEEFDTDVFNTIFETSFEKFIERRSMNRELHLSEGMTSIGESAFSDCSDLRGELCLPGTLTSIGDYAFYGCSGLSGELRLPESLKSIGDSAFAGCSGLSGELSLPESLKSIGDSAFAGCIGLSGELSLPNGLRRIGDRTFWGCSGLRGKLCLPEGLISIGNSAFCGCRGLSGELKLPEGLTSIGDHAFCGCRGLSGELKLPESLTSIGAFAFVGCVGLSGELKLPEGLTSIGDNTFCGCSNLSGELCLPEGLMSIGGSAFYGCSGLSGELSLPKGLISIGDSAFRDCNGLNRELHLPDGLKSIGAYAFYGCSGLRGELCLPKGLVSIGSAAFVNCKAIKKMIFYNPTTEIPASMNPYASTVICGYRNSTAEEYARTQGLVFVELEK